jgi:hypothetical protein
MLESSKHKEKENTYSSDDLNMQTKTLKNKRNVSNEYNIQTLLLLQCK